MTMQSVNIGAAPNDHIGDAIRVAFDKVNDNFTELYTDLYPSAAQSVIFANPLVCDATTKKDFKCASVTGNATVNLTNTSDGDSGFIELIIDAVGGYTITLGTMFTKDLGVETIDGTANADNFILWMKIGSDIIYSISQVA